MYGSKRVLVRDLNPHILCALCGGYLIQATTVIECLHSFCRSCIVNFLETSKVCPICDAQIHKTRPLLNIRADQTLQSLVYKLVPGLFQDEMRRRREFHATLSDSDVEDLTLEERGEASLEKEYKPGDDHVSLVLQLAARNDKSQDFEIRDCRYLLCPSEVTVKHLKKFIRLKFQLSESYQIDMYRSKEELTDDLMLQDIALIYSWRGKSPMHLYYLITEPAAKKSMQPQQLKSAHATCTPPQATHNPTQTIHRPPSSGERLPLDGHAIKSVPVCFQSHVTTPPTSKDHVTSTVPSKCQTISTAPSKCQTSPAAPSKCQTSPAAPSKCQTTPAAPSKDRVTPAAPSKCEMTPMTPAVSSKNHMTPPAPSKGHVTMPTSSKGHMISTAPNKVDTVSPSPSKCHMTSPATNQSHVTQPASNKSHTTPQAPSKSHTAPSAPSKGHMTLSAPNKVQVNLSDPSKGHMTPPAPSKGHVTPPTPNKSHVTPQSPSKGQVTSPAPSKGQVSPSAPSKGRVTPASPSKGHVTSTAPSKGHVTPSAPSKGHVTPPTSIAVIPPDVPSGPGQIVHESSISNSKPVSVSDTTPSLPSLSPLPSSCSTSITQQLEERPPVLSTVSCLPLAIDKLVTKHSTVAPCLDHKLPQPPSTATVAPMMTSVTLTSKPQPGTGISRHSGQGQASQLIHSVQSILNKSSKKTVGKGSTCALSWTPVPLQTEHGTLPAGEQQYQQMIARDEGDTSAGKQKSVNKEEQKSETNSNHPHPRVFSGAASTGNTGTNFHRSHSVIETCRSSAVAEDTTCVQPSSTREQMGKDNFEVSDSSHPQDDTDGIFNSYIPKFQKHRKHCAVKRSSSYEEPVLKPVLGCTSTFSGDAMEKRNWKKRKLSTLDFDVSKVDSNESSHGAVGSSSHTIPPPSSGHISTCHTQVGLSYSLSVQPKICQSVEQATSSMPHFSPSSPSCLVDSRSSSIPSGTSSYVSYLPFVSPSHNVAISSGAKSSGKSDSYQGNTKSFSKDNNRYVSNNNIINKSNNNTKEQRSSHNGKNKHSNSSKNNNNNNNNKDNAMLQASDTKEWSVGQESVRKTKHQVADSVATKNQPANSVASKNQPANSVASKNQTANRVASKNQPVNTANSVATKKQTNNSMASKSQTGDSVATKKQRCVPCNSNSLESPSPNLGQKSCGSGTSKPARPDSTKYGSAVFRGGSHGHSVEEICVDISSSPSDVSSVTSPATDVTSPGTEDRSDNSALPELQSSCDNSCVVNFSGKVVPLDLSSKKKK